MLALVINSSRNAYTDFDICSIQSIFKALVLEFKLRLIMNLLLPSSFPE